MYGNVKKTMNKDTDIQKMQKSWFFLNDLKIISVTAL